MNNELWRLSATQLAEGYRSGAYTPVDALDACLARAEACQPALNAMVFIDRAGARNAAEESRARWISGTPVGPLDGIPVSVKDNLHVAGQPTRWGSRLLQEFVPKHDELPVARLRAAGAVLFGKTNLPEFAMQGYTSNDVSGTTRNPWDLSLTPGGSSGGAAAAVASGCGPLALATDGGGSIRRPASHCGVIGFKPSAGLVPRKNGLPEIFLDFEVAGCIGRELGDVQNLMQVLSATPMTAPPPRAARILYVPRFDGQAVDSGIATQTENAAKQFENLGHRVIEAPSFDIARQINLLWPNLSAAGLAWMFADSSRFPELGLAPGQSPDISLCGDAAQAALRLGLNLKTAALFDLMTAVQILKRKVDDLFTRHDFILTPATAALPWPAQLSHPQEIAGQPAGPRGHAVFTALANAAGLPAIALPCGFAGNLPTGFQLIGRAGADASLLALARQYEQAHPWKNWPAINTDMEIRQ